MSQLSQRDENILLSLKKLDFLNRSQLQKIHRLGKVRNTNRVLQKLSPWLNSFREYYDTVYYLNAQGREYVDSKKVLRKNQFVPHVLMRNDFYCHAGFPVNWKNEVKVKDGETTVIPDAFFNVKKKQYFLEVDNQNKMSDNRSKAKLYQKLHSSGALQQHFGYFPTIIIVTKTELRRKQLSELFGQLPHTVLLHSDII
jgi:hypothetical protein